jgi:hypothetical protein
MRGTGQGIDFARSSYQDRNELDLRSFAAQDMLKSQVLSTSIDFNKGK